MISNPAAEALRILIVDNCEETLEVRSTVFATMGYLVRNAKTNSDALEIAIDFMPNAVFTSIVGADQRGLDLCLALRNVPGSADSLIVALSPYGRGSLGTEVVERFDYFLVNPVTLENILETMRKLIGYKGSNVPLIRIPFACYIKPYQTI
jgi:CheY-like chemotaxis protein